jgi:phosphohistidine phosphatase
MAGPHLVMLLRHAIAEQTSGSGRDADRRLTGEGKRKLREVAAGMRALELPVDAILTSPLRRAQETAAILAGAYDAGDRVEVTPALAPGSEPDHVLKALGSCRSAFGVVLVGHEPQMGELVSTLLVGTPSLVRVAFKKAGLAGIVVESFPPRAAGVLEFFLTPGQLRRIGRAGR